MKRILLFLSAIVLLAACTPKDTDRAALEPYAKEHMENPDTYEFASMSMPREYTYMQDLIVYTNGIKDLREKAADKTSYDAELQKIMTPDQYTRYKADMEKRHKDHKRGPRPE